MDKSITLPPDEIFRNLENAKRFAIDIGNRAQNNDISVLCLIQKSRCKASCLGYWGKGELEAVRCAGHRASCSLCVGYSPCIAVQKLWNSDYSTQDASVYCRRKGYSGSCSSVFQ